MFTLHFLYKNPFHMLLGHKVKIANGQIRHSVCCYGWKHYGTVFFTMMNVSISVYQGSWFMTNNLLTNLEEEKVGILLQ